MKHIHNKYIIKSLPLLASVLGKRYGVEIYIGGAEAKTDGKIICLPSLPLECDDTFLNLLRGYVDHEAAHVRFTDFSLLQVTQLTDFEKYVWNCIEDWRIEQKMSSHFHGCKINLLWLIEHIFYTQELPKKVPLEKTLSEWILLSLRAWDAPSLAPQVMALEKVIQQAYPQLLTELGDLLLNLQKQCDSTEEAIQHAQNIVRCIEKYIQRAEMEKRIAQQQNDADGNDNLNKTKGLENEENITRLKTLLSSDIAQLPKNIGEKSKEFIEKQRATKSDKKLQVARIGTKTIKELEGFAIQKSLRIATSLKARLQGLLQAQTLQRHLPATRGRINAHRLHALSVQESRVFLKHAQREATNTAVHILFDTSGSMTDSIDMASQTCFALASALGNTKGINVAVTTFPVNIVGNSTGVFPLLKHGQKVGSQFCIRAHGSTPLAESLWWVYQTLLQQNEPRKIILLLTDGDPDNKETALHAIKYAEKIGIEIYGIGIPPCNIQNILPEDKSITLESMNHLPQVMFGLLQHALINHN